jgi:hypothetical protein
MNPMRVLNVELFSWLMEAKVLIEGSRQHYYTRGAHSSLRYNPPAREAFLWQRRNSNQLRRPPSLAPEADHALTYKPDHPAGAGQDSRPIGKTAPALASAAASLVSLLASVT